MFETKAFEFGGFPLVGTLIPTREGCTGRFEIDVPQDVMSNWIETGAWKTLPDGPIGEMDGESVCLRHEFYRVDLRSYTTGAALKRAIADELIGRQKSLFRDEVRKLPVPTVNLDGTIIGELSPVARVVLGNDELSGDEVVVYTATEFSSNNRPLGFRAWFHETQEAAEKAQASAEEIIRNNWMVAAAAAKAAEDALRPALTARIVAAQDRLAALESRIPALLMRALRDQVPQDRNPEGATQQLIELEDVLGKLERGEPLSSK